MQPMRSGLPTLRRRAQEKYREFELLVQKYETDVYSVRTCMEECTVGERWISLWCWFACWRLLTEARHVCCHHISFTLSVWKKALTCVRSAVLSSARAHLWINARWIYDFFLAPWIHKFGVNGKELIGTSSNMSLLCGVFMWFLNIMQIH